MRGIFAEQKESEIKNIDITSTVPCYIGMAPLWQTGAGWKEKAGKCFLLQSLSEAKKKIGYMEPTSGGFSKENSLSEVLYTHFKLIGSAPILVITNRQEFIESEDQTVEVVISNGKGVVHLEGKAILDSLTIDGKVLGDDFKASYDDMGKDIIIQDLKGSLEKTTTVKYKEVTFTDVTLAAETFDCLDTMEQDTGVIPARIAAPLWEETSINGETVYQKLKEISESVIDSHWYTQAFVQMYAKTVDTLKTEKSNKGVNSSKVKACWGFIRKGDLYVSMASVFSAAKALVDAGNDGVPYQSASNFTIEKIHGICNQDGSSMKMTQETANDINEIGVCTANFLAGNWRTWGPYMSNYSQEEEDDGTIDFQDASDTAVQMKDYICNNFQRTNVDYIDKDIPRKRAEEIADDYQINVLDTFLNAGYLLFAEIKINEDETSLKKGKFTFNIQETSTPSGRMITANVMYSDQGLKTYTEEEE